MTDIVERLRHPWFTNGCEAYQLEAATEIERLRKHAEALAKFDALLPSCAGMADAPNDTVVAVYLRIGEIRAVRDFVAAYRAEYPEEK